ncbi:coenzyme PQQ biosynthesis protein PqqF, partial [Pseudomonas syringae pv. tagetis]
GAASGNSDEAALYQRWELPSAQPALWLMLHAGLKPLIEDAHLAGVVLAFSAYGAYWLLQLNGLRAPMVAVIEHGLH